MQGYVPYVIHRKTNKRLIKSIFTAVFIIFLIVFLFVFLVSLKKQSVCFESQTFYFVYADKAKNEAPILAQQDRVKSLGGSGVIYKKNNTNYLLINCYLIEDDVKDVKNRVSTEFANSDTLKITVKAISKNVQKEVRESQGYYKFFNFKREFFQFFLDKEMEYIKGNLSDGKFISWIISKRLELNSIKEEFIKDSKIESFMVINQFADVFVLHFDNLLNKFFESTKKQSLICEFYCNLVLTNADMCDNL